MASPEKSEPESMEDILASIRKIIAEDPPRKAASAIASDATATAVLEAVPSTSASAKSLSLGTPLPRAGSESDKKVLFQPPSARDVLFRRPAEPEKAPEARAPELKEPEFKEATFVEPELKAPEFKAPELKASEPKALEPEPDATEPPAIMEPLAAEPEPAKPELVAPEVTSEAAGAVEAPAAETPAPAFASLTVERALADLLEDFDVTAAIANGKGASHEPHDEKPEAKSEADALADAITTAAEEISAESAAEPVEVVATIEPPEKPALSFAEAVEAILKPAAEPLPERSGIELPMLDVTEAEFGGRLLEEPAPETTRTLPSALARAIAGDDDFLEMPAWAAALRSDQPQADEPKIDEFKTDEPPQNEPKIEPKLEEAAAPTATVATPPPLKNFPPATGSTNELAGAIARVASAISPTEQLYGTLKAGDLSDGLASALSRLAGDADTDTAAASTTALKELAAGLAASSNREAAAAAVPPIPKSDFMRTSPPKLDPPKFEAPKPEFTRPEFIKPDALRPPPPPMPVSSVAPEAVFEDTVSKLLKPMLQQWLTENMPRIIENALRAEVGETLGKPPGKPRV